jgi:acyl-CoA synthetase (AMP-forming)/AMP-acid ligase II
VATATYGELFGRASYVARELAARGIGAGDPAMLLMESRLEFYDALFGALLAGALPVAVYPPASRRTLASSIDHLRRVASRLPARVILSSRGLYGVARQIRATGTAVMVIDRTPAAGAGVWPGESVAADAPVLLQYTSGSLGERCAVELSACDRRQPDGDRRRIRRA